MLSFGNSLDNHYKTHFLNDAQRLIIRCPFFISHAGLHYVNNFLVTVIQCTWTVFVHVCICKLLLYFSCGQNPLIKQRSCIKQVWLFAIKGMP